MPVGAWDMPMAVLRVGGMEKKLAEVMAGKKGNQTVAAKVNWMVDS